MGFDFDPAALTGTDGAALADQEGWQFTGATYRAHGPGGRPAVVLTESQGVTGAADRDATYTVNTVVTLDAGGAVGIGWPPPGTAGGCGLVVYVGGVDVQGDALTMNVPMAMAGTHVVSFTTAPDGSAVYVDGALVGSDPLFEGIDIPAALVTLESFGGTVTVSRVVGVDGPYDPGVVADLLDLYASTGMTAKGTWSVSGAAEVTASDPWTDPDYVEPEPGGSVTPPPPPEPSQPPAGVPAAVIRRHSEIMPAPALDARGNPVNWTPTSVVSQEYARLQVVVEGVDITYWGGVPIPHPQWDRQEPFGSGSAAIELPQITAFHALPSWCRAGANVDIRLAKVGGGTVHRFAGVLMSFGHREDSGVFTLECMGVVFAADLQLRQPAWLTTPRDIGSVLAEVLNTAVSRRYSTVAPVVTGCKTGVLGGWEPRLTGYATQLLATAVTRGRQWTVQCAERSPVIALKDTTTVTWSVSNGQRGVEVDLRQDWSQAPNVLFASGVGPDGGLWQNAKYPNWHRDDTPPYPWNNPSRTMRVGDTDASTDTGDGVSVWQAKAGRPVTGRYSQADRARVREIQKAGGIQVDGILGPQTWATTFDTGANTGTLECFYMPVAFSTKVMPRLYGPDGDDLGPNPAYDPGVVRVEEKIDFGHGVSKAEGVRAAKEMHARGIDPGWSGTVTFQDVDPEEMSRYEISEGSNGRIRHFRGQTLTVHAARVDYAEEAVTVTVDTKARDFPTLDAIRERERNATDPAKAIVKRLHRSDLSAERATFDAESPAGQLPRHAVFSNLWDVRRIPFGAYGSIVRTEIRTTGPAREFAVAVFDRPITAARLLSLVGNPLTADENPWSNNGEALDDAGLLMAWGWNKQPLGYWPREYSTPDGESGAPVTGKFVDDASWEYVSQQAPWLWVCTIASGSTFVAGRFWPGVD